uniref:Uncharacterized protein n=1 Tax=Parastrongyloides trichosuri TaxID=131310 RepID=A0A0N5A5D3_PARTI
MVLNKTTTKTISNDTNKNINITSRHNSKYESNNKNANKDDVDVQLFNKKHADIFSLTGNNNIPVAVISIGCVITIILIAIGAVVYSISRNRRRRRERNIENNVGNEMLESKIKKGDGTIVFKKKSKDKKHKKNKKEDKLDNKSLQLPENAPIAYSEKALPIPDETNETKKINKNESNIKSVQSSDSSLSGPKIELTKVLKHNEEESSSAKTEKLRKYKALHYLLTAK